MTRLVPAAAGVLASWLVAAIHNADIVASLTQPAVARALAADAFLAEILLVILFAPLMGAGAATRPRHVAWTASAFVLLSLAIGLAVSSYSGYPSALVVRAHLALALAGAALAGLGAVAASFCRSELDAAGLAVALALVAAAAILVGGPRTADLSEGAIDRALLANPLIAVSAAADMDLLRREMLYQLSPVSHRRFTYPAWQTTTASYGIVALGCLAICVVRSRQKGPIA